MSDSNRTGMFTPRMRSYLTGELDNLDTAPENALRGDIRNRVRTAFAELQLLAKLDQHERELIFNAGKEVVEMPDGKVLETQTYERGNGPRVCTGYEPKGPIALGLGFSSFLEFYYKMNREAGYSAKSVCFEIKKGIEKAESEYGRGFREVEASVDIESVSEVDIGDAKERYKKDEDLSSAELRALFKGGHLELQDSDD